MARNDEPGPKRGSGNFVAYPSAKAMNYSPATPKRNDTTGINRHMMDGHVPQDQTPPPPVSPPYGRSGRK